ncbi:hypothetical protein PFICI_08426 [Pestalotiopsis fici W106-1]|uniref:HhH-GPD domain-containing protein n=1 Tax=Pestalotiopsis fici (strain W106-1 / CGMCC3.15140) TaxID=1229662 RepID=W3X685_PESFW|nr:uncharacterized protein PFICI_08426 [Pestalotiopsis fici W106-1]ETS80897.1 hypothetical protein PFICI_08426 [Pestalotiopsis fici W106-1]
MARSAINAESGAPRRSQRNIKANSTSNGTIKNEADLSDPYPHANHKATATTPKSGRVKRVKPEEEPGLGAPEALESSTPKSRKRIKREASASENVKEESPSPRKVKKEKTKADKAADLQAKKLKQYAQFSKASPFPDFAHPTPEECKLARKILVNLHGDRQRPEEVVAPTNRAGCGDSRSVLDALVRTILSQNTSDKNSTRAKLSMDKAYGGSDKWDAIVEGGQAKLQKTIESGGLSQSKSRVIIDILQQAKAKYGTYSLDHLFEASDEDAMREMLAMHGVGPKTASCVLLFCLRRESFAVDTHVHRITGLLGWRPRDCSREESHAHLDARIPDEDKYALHILIINHGKRCDECKAGGKNTGKCELRKAFRGGKIKGEAGEAVKEEEIEKIKEEESESETEKDAIAHAVEST